MTEKEFYDAMRAFNDPYYTPVTGWGRLAQQTARQERSVWTPQPGFKSVKTDAPVTVSSGETKSEGVFLAFACGLMALFLMGLAVRAIEAAAEWIGSLGSALGF